ncbi:DUF3962 domain-containing protein [Catellatospora sp. NPDC049111]|uniref:pPIWI_RE module domain-containing protein n=1 Tax=Catellatospora sp. NPDC049111 TaxID=3155271 RepID=UPI0033F2257D
MARPYKDISRAAYVLDSHAEPLVGEYSALPFPEHWSPDILRLCNLGRDPDAEPYRNAPTARMDGLLQTLAPDLVVRARTRDPRTSPGHDHWLYRPTDLANPLPGTTFDQLTGAWLRDLRPEPEHHRAVVDTLRALREQPPVWEEARVELLTCAPTQGGTAITTPRQRQLAPDAIARRILALAPYEHGAGTLTFRAVPRGPRQQGAELLSQPLPHEAKDQTWWFSIFIAITLHTIPFDPRPRIHLHAGVRRWITRCDKTGRVRLPGRTATSVYLTPKIPWLAGAPATERFAIASLAFDRATARHQWGKNGPARVLRQLQLSQPFPDPEMLLADPSAWIGDGPGVRAAIVHSNRMGSHAIGAGLMSHQRSQLIEWAEQAMPAGVRRVSHLTRSALGGTAPQNARATPVDATAKKAEQLRVANARRAALAVATRVNLGSLPPADTYQPIDLLNDNCDVPVLRARLLWQTPELRDAAITALAEELDLEGDGRWPQPAYTDEDFAQATPTRPAILTWQADDLTVVLQCIALTATSEDAPGLGEKLGIDPKKRPRGKALEEAIRTRRNATREFHAINPHHTGQPELALVEIDRRQDFDFRWDDPKYAIRLGSADAGVLTQFALVPKKAKNYNSVKNLHHRVRSAWQDGFRQLGVRVLPQHTLGGLLPVGLRYAAVWMVKRRSDGPTGLPRHTPLAVMVTPLGTSGLATVHGWDPELQQWISYPRMLLSLVKHAEIPEVESDDLPSVDVNAAAATTIPLQATGAHDGDQKPGRRAPYKVWKQNVDEQRQATATFLQRLIRSLRGQPTLLLVHAQNSRLHWPWIQDGQVEPDLIKTGHAPASTLDPNVRILRVRDGGGRETAQWWGISGPGRINGLPPGLWTYPDTCDEGTGRVFYSTTAKASTFRDSAVEADRLAPRPRRLGINRGQPTIDAQIPAWNPALVELAVLACQTHDSPEAFALAAHQLRQAPDYLDALLTPLPLHMASLAQEYVLPTIASDDGADTFASDDGADTLDDTEPAVDPQGSHLGIVISTTSSDDATGDPQFSAAPGLSQPPEDQDDEDQPTSQQALFALPWE